MWGNPPALAAMKKQKQLEMEEMKEMEEMEEMLKLKLLAAPETEKLHTQPGPSDHIMMMMTITCQR